jgi:hypothetical protein
MNCAIIDNISDNWGKYLANERHGRAQYKGDDLSLAEKN